VGRKEAAAAAAVVVVVGGVSLERGSELKKKKKC
jgi:hypothetical protein